MKAAVASYRPGESDAIRSALTVLHELKFFERLDEQLIHELAGRTIASDSESDLVAVCREIRHRRAYLRFLETETAELVAGPDNLGD